MEKHDIKIGDVFVARVDGKYKYFQYIANDISQLNSDVIKGFVKEYNLGDKPDLPSIVKDDAQFYAHCVIKWGIKMGLWNKIGAAPVQMAEDVVFRDTNDWGRNKDVAPVRVSSKWFVWRVNKEFEQVGTLTDELRRKSYVGLVINPHGIIELLKGNKYPPNYPD